MESLWGVKVNGERLAEDMFCYVVDKGACEKIVEEQTEGMSREEIVKYTASILYGILCIKQDIVNTRLFGKKNPRL